MSTYPAPPPPSVPPGGYPLVPAARPAVAPPGPGTPDLHGPSTTDGHGRAPEPHGAPRRGRAVPVLAVLLALALGLTAYLWVTTVSWRDTSGTWEAEATRYATEVGTLRSRLEGVNAELTAAREQLATATGRITDLANEKAQLGDENVASQQYLEYQQRVSEAAGVVATALGQCTDGQQQLIGYLKDPGAYDPADLERFEAQVADLCTQARDANAALQQELQR